MRARRRRGAARHGLTMVELLVVVAIIAMVGGGVAATYGRKTIDASNDQMTLQEMHEIKKAFLRFHGDNYLRLQRKFEDHTGNDFPIGDFGYDSGNPAASERFYEQMAFYETYGLWFLMQPAIPGVIAHDNPGASEEDSTRYRFPIFGKYDARSGEGWNGPYLDAGSRSAWSFGSFHFPQIADKHGGTYHLLYYEHCEDDNDPTEPIYRRLLLVAPRGNVSTDEIKEDDALLDLTGNLRGGSDAGPLDPDTGAIGNRFPNDESDDDDEDLFVLELLNMDQHRQ